MIGTLYVRHINETAPNGKPCMIVFGVLSTNDKHPLQGECQYVVTSADMGGMPALIIHTDAFVNHAGTRLEGLSVDQLFWSPIWKVGEEKP